ncbi:aldehyde oxidase and xanthine dehydrogenase molybdopterin binding protein [Gemmatirosa kalamazoonensis]|uniref:Aldehyde oxidase and xanthine dehydrogenase molybdopterin binding protein n=1 Tax=Gemmatirosa kalamazoonensis TaxID=861299 RepID=W0RFU6_9BACT|nr:xanthine dehydrogenase family protein molybdopterin-binding subunit [Gemmatirosa kalamazoonensis]AHG89185.1 aldehyde oxidase and xanthine dehydrogenase molybdopterin binding protein [Gemmatirosa kalamazoonensis]
MTTRDDAVGRPLERVDGRLKVTGAARYAAEMPVAGVAHAVLITSTVARARIQAMDTSAAERAPGVLKVLTPFNAPRLPGAPRPGPQEPPAPPAPAPTGTGAQGPAARGAVMRVPTLLQDEHVRYNGQPIGVVVAETFEQALAATHLVTVRYAAERPVLDMASAPKNPPEKVHPLGGERATHRGDVARGLADAVVHVEHTYTTPLENHNPMEPHNTVAVWEGDALTLYDSTQGITSVRNTVAQHFGVPREKVRVVSHFTGGGFGSKGGPWSHQSLAAMAARETGRPVKLVLTRRQMFGPVGGRPRTVQRVTLGADRSGALTAIRHTSTSNTSTLEDWIEPALNQTKILYACPNLEAVYDVVRLNVGSPTFQRAPGESTGTFALESAMDELAIALEMDPIELRLRNHADTDPETGHPWSSKSLRECYRAAAERFGWSKRTAAPRSMRDGRALVGWGMATATYPARRNPASCTARMLPDGRAWVRAGTQEIGCGTYTSMTQVAADALGIAPDRVRFELGETDMPENPASTGSVTMASTGTAVHDAASALRRRLVQLAVTDPASPLSGAAEGDVVARDGRLSLASDASRGESYEALMARQSGRVVEVTTSTRAGPEAQQYAMHSFGAVFAEVHVDEDLGTIRVPRVVTAHGVGRIVNPQTARSQIVGGVVWGVGMALLEETLVDPRTGRYLNADLAEYHVPVNADIGTIDTIFVDENDPHVSAIGAKGAGEIGITGVAAAIANAVHHATGVRVRDLPITLDKIRR